ncbi:MAG: hypothetical protein RBR97_07130 [Bacteroidales bacterium]|nr:hypothetical protein [Bacteroidales bacterium]
MKKYKEPSLFDKVKINDERFTNYGLIGRVCGVIDSYNFMVKFENGDVFDYPTYVLDVKKQ